MESEEIIKLEDLENLLNREIETIDKIKRKLDNFARIVREIDEKEGELLVLLQESKNLNERMFSYFDESDIYEKIQAIRQKIISIESEYEQKGFYVEEEISKTEFNDELLNKYYKDLCLFLGDKIKFVKDIMRCQREILDESISKVRSELGMLHRLIDTLARKIESASMENKLKEFLNLRRGNIEKVKLYLPSKLEDLEEIYRKNMHSFKGLYRKIMSDISSLREELRKFAIENGLIEEEEIVVLETIYCLDKREFEFNEILEVLNEKMPKIGGEKVQNILLNLSRKGFLILKLIAD
jgi:hypothetical protein